MSNNRYEMNGGTLTKLQIFEKRWRNAVKNKIDGQPNGQKWPVFLNKSEWASTSQTRSKTYIESGRSLRAVRTCSHKLELFEITKFKRALCFYDAEMGSVSL